MDDEDSVKIEGVVADITEHIRKVLFSEKYYTERMEYYVDEILKNKKLSANNRNSHNVREFLRKTCFIFNGGIVNVSDGLFLIASRIILPQHFLTMFESNIPTMWKSIDVFSRTYGGGWDNKIDAAGVFLFKIYDLDNDLITLRLLDAKIIDLGLGISYEDPRLYRKSDQNIYLSTNNTYFHKNCPYKEDHDCSFMSETLITISPELKIEIDITKQTTLCENVISEMILHGNYIIKNWSHVAIDGKNYFVDFYPRYKIYLQQDDLDCNFSEININDNFGMLNIGKMIDIFKIITNTAEENAPIKTSKLFSFAGTTPSVKLDIDLDGKEAYAAVAHIRSNVGHFLEMEDDLFDFFIDSLSENEYMNNYVKFLLQTRKLFKLYSSGYKKAYLHPDIYMMCVYYFNSDFEIVGFSDVFIPITYYYNDLHVEYYNTRFLLAFPTGLMSIGEKIYITYGEGDTKLRLMVVDIKKLNFHRNDENLINKMNFRLFNCVTRDFYEERTIKEMIQDQFFNYNCNYII